MIKNGNEEKRLKIFIIGEVIIMIISTSFPLRYGYL